MQNIKTYKNTGALGLFTVLSVCISFVLFFYPPPVMDTDSNNRHTAKDHTKHTAHDVHTVHTVHYMFYIHCILCILCMLDETVYMRSHRSNRKTGNT